MSLFMRNQVNGLVKIKNPTAFNDLIGTKPDGTYIVQTDLIAALWALVNPMIGFKLLLTSIKSDHDDDSALGPHSHAAGYCVDIGSVGYNDEPMEDVGAGRITGELVRFCLERPNWFTQIGLGGAAKTYLTLGSDFPNADLFADNDQPHIHLGTV